VPAGAALYMLDVVYYRDAQQGVYERDGRIRPDIAVRYASRRDFHPTDRSFYVWCYLGRPPALEELGKVTDLGRALYRVDA
jgi:hypothetical protein